MVSQHDSLLQCNVYAFNLNSYTLELQFDDQVIFSLGKQTQWRLLRQLTFLLDIFKT